MNAPISRSASRRPTSPRRATTSRSTDTRRSCTTRSSIAPPLEIIADLERLEGEIQQGLSELKAVTLMASRRVGESCRA